jgi:hypothetical protein
MLQVGIKQKEKRFVIKIQIVHEMIATFSTPVEREIPILMASQTQILSNKLKANVPIGSTNIAAKESNVSLIMLFRAL